MTVLLLRHDSNVLNAVMVDDTHFEVHGCGSERRSKMPVVCFALRIQKLSTIEVIINDDDDDVDDDVCEE